MPIRVPDEFIPGGSAFKVVSTANVTASTIGNTYIPYCNSSGILTKSGLAWSDGDLYINGTKSTNFSGSTASLTSSYSLDSGMLNGYTYNTLPHNSMSGLQGSQSATDFYHLTQPQYNQLRTYFISTG